MYTCGITPYDVTHVGHAATFVWADLVASLAHATGTEALVARNVTDVDDVLTVRGLDSGAALRRARPDPGVPLRPGHEGTRRRTARRSPRTRARSSPRGSAWPRRCWLPARPTRSTASSTSEARRCPTRPASRRGRALELSRAYGDQDDPASPGVGLRRRRLAALRRRAPGVAEPVGLGPSGLARRVRRDGDGQPGQLGRRGARRVRPHVPAPRLPGGDGRGGDRRTAVRAVRHPRGGGAAGRREDGEVDRQPRAGQRPARAAQPGARCGWPC